VDDQPRSGIRATKGPRDRLIALAQRHPDWARGFEDATWWSRLARPHLHTWVDDPADGPLRLIEQAAPADDPDPKAMACSGLLLRQAGQGDRVWLRFVDGRPVSAITEQFLESGAAPGCARWACAGGC
jgi:hypothetical protein